MKTKSSLPVIFTAALAGLLAIPAAIGQVTAQPGASFQNRLNDIARQANGPGEKPPVLTRLDLDFPGGTPEELVAAIEKSSGKPLNVVIAAGDRKVQLPPLKMRAVTVPELFQALEHASRRMVSVFRSPSPQPAQVNAPPIEETSYGLMRSQPLSPGMVIETRPGAAHVLLSAPDNVAVVETNPGQPLYKELSDDQLLALLAGRPAALVRHSPPGAELFLLNPEDQNGFRLAPALDRPGQN